jgi:hypothetical protein
LVGTQNRFAWLLAAALVILACSPQIGWSQGVEAALGGRAAPNAQITVRNTAAGLTRRTQVLVSIEKPYTEESRWGMTSALTSG